MRSTAFAIAASASRAALRLLLAQLLLPLNPIHTNGAQTKQRENERGTGDQDAKHPPPRTP